jgi:hypothetical protein
MSIDGNLAEVISISIASIALAGVAISLVLQNRGLRANHLQMARSMQIELMRMSIENPALRAVFLLSDEPEDQVIQETYMNLMIKHLETGFVSGEFTKKSIELQGTFYFERLGFYAYWPKVRVFYITEARTRKQKSFVRIMDSQYRTSSLSKSSEETTLVKE